MKAGLQLGAQAIQMFHDSMRMRAEAQRFGEQNEELAHRGPHRAPWPKGPHGPQGLRGRFWVSSKFFWLYLGFSGLLDINIRGIPRYKSE